jgi:hypothetical protein
MLSKKCVASLWLQPHPSLTPFRWHPSFLMLCFAICRIPPSTLLPTFLVISIGTGDPYHKFTPPIHVSFFAVYSQWNCPGRVRFPFAWERGREAKSCCPISLSHIFVSTVVPVVRKSGRYNIIFISEEPRCRKRIQVWAFFIG